MAAEFSVPKRPPPDAEECLRVAMYRANTYGTATRVTLEGSHQVAWIVPEWMYRKALESAPAHESPAVRVAAPDDTRTASGPH